MSRNLSRLATRTLSRGSSPNSRPMTTSSQSSCPSLSARSSSRGTARSPIPPVSVHRYSCNEGNNTEGNCQPVSIDFEYRAVLVGTTHVVIDIRNFRAVYRANPIPKPELLPEAVDKILKELKVDRIEAQNRVDIIRIFTSKNHKVILRKYGPEVGWILTTAKQAKHFDSITRHLLYRLGHCFQKHARRYFLSYANEGDAAEISAVRDYEDYIRRSTDLVAARIASIEDGLEKYKSLQDTFLSNYMENLGIALGIIGIVCNDAMTICATLKQWVYKDKDYTKRLWECIINTNMRRGKILEEIKRSNRKKSELTFQIERQTEAHQRASKSLEEKKLEGSHVKTSREALTLKLSQTLEEIQKKSAELQETRHQLQNRKSNSPKYLEALNRKLEQLQSTLSTLEDRKKALQRQVAKLVTSGRRLETGSEALTAECDGNAASLTTLKSQLEEVMETLGHLEKEASGLEERVVTARHIRGLKVSSAQLRKLYLHATDGSNGFQ